MIHLIKTVNVLPDACVNDLFQHVVYDNPGMSFEEICALYDKLTREFNPGLDYDGLPYYSEGMSWCRVIHFFQYPFYYIDYALAYTCSLQIAAPVLEGRPQEALETYLAFTKMGGTHDLLQTLDICGIDSPFKESTVEALARALGQYIDSHTDSLI